MTRWRRWPVAVLAPGLLAAGLVAAEEDGVRSRTLFDAGVDRARDLVVVLNPAAPPPTGSEVSVYLPIRFAHDSAELSVPARRNLAVIAEALAAPALAAVGFVVEGHTDASGGAAYNDALSFRRASSAAEYLVALGVRASRLTVRGRGESDLLAGVDPLAAAQRRVEIVRQF
ncbi:MAG: OmpA family protein [Alphaproteobacteria bacterium]|nr:OmpA family protein [Alphaproteobacteria bacterium]